VSAAAPLQVVIDGEAFFQHARSDIPILPSAPPCHEEFASPVVEAMAGGCPVVMSDMPVSP
jgi:glycosyltransferase involved in cell wall biosynthesis